MSPQEAALARQYRLFGNVPAIGMPVLIHPGAASWLQAPTPKEGHGPSGVMGTMVGSRSHLVPLTPPRDSVPRREGAVGDLCVETGTVGCTGKAVGKIRHSRAQR